MENGEIGVITQRRQTTPLFLIVQTNLFVEYDWEAF